MLATILEVLDTSVANVAVPNIAGNLSASTDEATWVLTSYLVSNAIVLPMTGWLCSFFGRKRFLIACIAFFTLASAACGAATTLGFLIFARVAQGAAGGALQPLSQAILMESFPPAKRGMAMAVFGLGVVVAPDHRAGAGGLDYRQLLLALDLLHQRPAGRPGGPHVAGLRRRPALPARRPRETRRHDRLYRFRGLGDLAGHAANHPRPRPGGRLVQRDAGFAGRRSSRWCR